MCPAREAWLQVALQARGPEIVICSECGQRSPQQTHNQLHTTAALPLNHLCVSLPGGPSLVCQTCKHGISSCKVAAMLTTVPTIGRHEFWQPPKAGLTIALFLSKRETDNSHKEDTVNLYQSSPTHQPCLRLLAYARNDQTFWSQDPCTLKLWEIPRGDMYICRLTRGDAHVYRRVFAQKLVSISDVILGSTVCYWVLTSSSRERVKRCDINRPKRRESVLTEDSI